MFPGPENHAMVEGAEYKPGFLEVDTWGEIARIIGESNKTAEESDYMDFEREALTLYRGDSGSVINKIRKEDGSLERDFPIYFTSSEEDAVQLYATGKVPGPTEKTEEGFRSGEVRSSDGYLIEISVPFEAVRYLDHQTSQEIEIEPDKHELEEERMHFMHEFAGSAEFSATRIPPEWMERIEQL